MTMSRSEAMSWKPTRLWTDAQKIEEFDYLYTRASEQLDLYKENSPDNCDDWYNKEEIYEEVMRFLGDDIWHVITVLSD